MERRPQALVTPMLHAQYSSLPHQNTFKVEDSLEILWDDVIAFLCSDDEYDMRFNPLFLKNPLHFSYRLISQLVHMVDAILLYTPLLKVKQATTCPTAHEKECLHFMAASFATSISALNHHESEASVDAEALEDIISLCSDVSTTLNMPEFLKFRPLQDVLGRILDCITLTFKALHTDPTPPTAPILPITSKEVEDQDPSNLAVKAVGGLHPSWQTSSMVLGGDSSGSDTLVLCVPCAPPPSVRRAAGKRRRNRALLEEDVFRPNKHVYNGLCPCCD